MCKIIAVLEDEHGDQFEEVYKEAGGFGVADSLKKIWRKDRQRNEFYSDQLCCKSIGYSVTKYVLM